jgi:predicted esterase
MNRNSLVKILQESQEKIWDLTSNWQLRTVESRPSHPKAITLLLHGYNERGLRIFRKLSKYLPSDHYIIAPDAPFPLPRVKSDRLDFGYAWYFYDPFTKSYQVDQKLVLGLLSELISQANPEGLPVNIIGFSQGGYLAPLVGYSVDKTQHVIGVGCEFRTRFFATAPKFTLDAIHGAMDTIVSPENSLAEIALLKELGIEVSWHLLHELKHELNAEVGLTIKNILEQYGEGSL